jgi:hypothetical protein
LKATLTVEEPLLEAWIDRNKKPLLLILMMLFAAHFAVVLYHAVDVPFMDEWEALSPSRRFNLASRPIFSYLTYHHLETRLFFTHLQEYVSWLLTSWDNRFYVAWSFALYGILLGLHLWIQKKIRADVPFHVQFFSILPLLTPYFWEAHAWGQQSHIHYSILWNLILVVNLFKQRPRSWNYGLALLAMAAMIFSFSRGASAGLAVLVLFWIYQSFQRKFLWVVVFTLWSGFLYLLHFGFLGLEKPLTAHVGLIYPNSELFWNFFLNLGSRVFGFHDRSSILGLLAFVMLGGAVWILLQQQNFRLKRLDEGAWQLLAILGSGVAAMGAIAMGRASLGIEGSQLSRYAFANAQLLPYVMLIYWSQRSTERQKGRLAWTLLLVFTSVGFARSLGKSHYRDLEADRKAGLRCIAEHLQAGGHQPIVCPQIYPDDIRPMLEEAQRLNLSFLKSLPELPHKLPAY